MKKFIEFFLRPSMRRSDTAWLVVAALVGGGAGLLLGEKISLAVGLPFGLAATAFLHFTWRFETKQPC